MTRVKVIVEGQTEESFITNVLAPFLWPNIYLTPLVLGVPGHKGGNVKYARVKKDILLQLKQDPTAYCSTMLDLYGLGDGFPGTPAPPRSSGAEKAKHIEQAIYHDISAEAPELRPEVRFCPYLQVHEYEGLLFSDTVAFAAALGRNDLSEQLGTIRNAFGSPEDINDDPNAAPSKRIIRVYPTYKKVIEGTTAAQMVGIEKILRECPHFRSWVEQLSALNSPQ
jgi:Domain of unknown function (DUF4276)